MQISRKRILWVCLFSLIESSTSPNGQPVIFLASLLMTTTNCNQIIMYFFFNKLHMYKYTHTICLTLSNFLFYSRSAFQSRIFFIFNENLESLYSDVILQINTL
jgi:hypothetical protein